MLPILSLISDIVLLPVRVVALVALVTVETFYAGDSNLSNDKRFEYLIHQSFILKENMIFVQEGSSEMKPKKIGSLYVDSGHEYEKDPKMTNAELNEINHSGSDSYPPRVFVRIKSGATIRIDQILQHRSVGFAGNYYTIRAVIENGPYAGYKANIRSLFDNLGGSDDSLPKVDESRMLRIDS